MTSWTLPVILCEIDCCSFCCCYLLFPPGALEQEASRQSNHLILLYVHTNHYSPSRCQSKSKSHSEGTSQRPILSALIIFATGETHARKHKHKHTHTHTHTSRFYRLHLLNHPFSSRSSLSFTHRFARPLPASLPLVVLLPSCSFSSQPSQAKVLRSAAQSIDHCPFAASQNNAAIRLIVV